MQTAPGRYEGTIENAEASGNYFVNLGYRGPDNVQGVISSGVSVPYSDEYRELRSNPTTLETLARVTDGKVVNWKQTPDGRIDLARTIQTVDHFRRDAGLINPRSFAPSGRRCCGWRPACSWATWPSAGSRSTGARSQLAIANEWQKLRGQRGRDVERIHGEAQEPQGRGRRAARPLQSAARRESEPRPVVRGARLRAVRSASRSSRAARLA